jgi:hypothetical protein
MENIRNRLNIELVNNPKRLEKLLAKANFLDRTIYSENLTALHMQRERMLFNKALYIGMAILDLAKDTMYSFHYNVMLPRYGVERFRLMYTEKGITRWFHKLRKNLYKNSIYFALLVHRQEY